MSSTSIPLQSRHSPPPLLGRLERPRTSQSTLLPNPSYLEKLVKTTYNLTDRSRSNTRKSGKTISAKPDPVKPLSSKELVETTSAHHLYDLPPHPKASPEPRPLPVIYRTLEDWAHTNRTDNCHDEVLVNPQNLEDPVSRIWESMVRDIGFLTMFNFRNGALALCCPFGQVLLFTRKESEPTFQIPRNLKAILEDKYIRKAILHQKDVADFIQTYLDFQMQGTSNLYKTVQVYTTPGENGSGTFKFF